MQLLIKFDLHDYSAKEIFPVYLRLDRLIRLYEI